MQKLNNLLYFLAGAMVTMLVGFVVIKVQERGDVLEEITSQLGQMRTAAESPAVAESVETDDEEIAQVRTTGEKWQEGTISYNGESYRYNYYLKTYLFMGIDTEEAIYNMDTKDTGYQSDALFLLVADTSERTLTVITINRNTMAEIERFTDLGTSMGKDTAQICLQHAYGDGKKLSCSRVEEAVSNLFYNIPIQGYIALNMGAIPAMNEAIGGVTVTVLDDLNYASKGVDLKKGDTVTLNGQEAYCYLRGRDLEDFDSATERLRRQEQYITNFIAQLKQSETGETQVVDMYNAISDYTVTDIDFESLLTQLLQFDYDGDSLWTVPGETVTGESDLEEYNVDYDAFYDMVIRTFYKKTES